MIPLERGWLAFWILITAGSASSLLSIWVFRRFSNADKLRIALNRVLAHLLEFRLFADEPRLVLRAQRDLLAANAQLLRYATPPSLLLLLPFALLFVCAEALFEHAPLVPGQPAVVTAKGASPDAQLIASAQITVETPPVRIARLNEVSWRIRPLAPAVGELLIQSGGVRSVSRVVAGAGLRWIWTHGSLRVEYPPARIFHQHWLVWFCLGSALAALGYLLMP